MFAAHASVDSGSGVAGVERGLAQMRTRIEAAAAAKDSPPSRRPATHRSRWQALAPWLRWTLGLQFASIVLLAVLLVVPQERSQTGYRALGEPTQAGRANVVVRFRPDAAEREIRRALQDAGARLVDGPTGTDAYLLSVPGDRQAAALAGLRATPIVLLAESLDAGSRP